MEFKHMDKLALSFYVVLLALAQLLMTSCGDGGTTPTTHIAISYPGTLFGATAPNLKKSNSSPVATYYIPIFSTNNVQLAVKSVTVESNTNIWTATADDKCINGINSTTGSCNLIIGFNASLVNNASQLASIIMIKFSNGSIRYIPINGLLLSTKDIVMQAPSQIIATNIGQAYGTISIFNNSKDSFVIDEKSITASAGNWSFKINCNHGSKIVNAGSSCSIGMVNNAKVYNSKQIQISIPVTSKNGSKIINVMTNLIPLPTTNTPYLAYLGDVVPLINTSTTSFPLLNLGISSLRGINISGLPANIAQSNNCNNIAANGLCKVTLNVLSGMAPSLTNLKISPNNGVSGNIQQVNVTGQTLAVLPLQINFGTQFMGTTMQSSVIISNLGINPLNYQIGTINDDNFSVESGSCTSETLPGLSSCVFNITYKAPSVTATHSANLVVSSNTIGESRQTINMTAGSIAQTLSVSPLQLDFGTLFNGSTSEKAVTISNLGPTPLNYQIGTLNNNNFSIDDGNCTGNTLNGLSSCVFHINYLAPQTNESDSASLVINSSTPGQTPQTINMTAKSIFSGPWNNIINSSYTDTGSPVSALITSSDGNIILTIGNFLNHVWQLSSDGTTWVNISGSFSNFYNQTVTAFGLAFSNFFVGGYIDGAVSVCGISPNQCITALSPQPPFYVTSEVNVTQSRGSLGFEGVTDPNTGKLLISDDNGGINTIPGITSGVGRIAIDGTFGNATNLFVPLSNGHIVDITAPWTTITSDITPNNFISGEYAAVLYYDLNTNKLYAGTNLANVYMNTTPVSSSNWVRLTATPLSNTSFISSIATNTAGDVYVGLSSNSNKTSGGGVYILPHGETNFVVAGPTYTDKSAVTNIVFDGVVTQSMFIGTYLGNIWRQ